MLRKIHLKPERSEAVSGARDTLLCILLPRAPNQMLMEKPQAGQENEIIHSMFSLESSAVHTEHLSAQMRSWIEFSFSLAISDSAKLAWKVPSGLGLLC